MGANSYKLRSGTRLACSYMWGREVFELWQAELQYDMGRAAWERSAMTRAEPYPYPLTPSTSNRWPWSDWL